MIFNAIHELVGTIYAYHIHILYLKVFYHRFDFCLVLMKLMITTYTLVIEMLIYRHVFGVLIFNPPSFIKVADFVGPKYWNVMILWLWSICNPHSWYWWEKLFLYHDFTNWVSVNVVFVKFSLDLLTFQLNAEISIANMIYKTNIFFNKMIYMLTF